MKNLLKHIGCFLIAFIPVVGFSQPSEGRDQLEAVIESILENMEEETDATLIIEDLEGFANDPLNINTAGRNELSRLHLLNDIQIQQLINYRNEFGPVYSIYELNVVDGFTPQILQKMEPFIWFGPVEKAPESLRKKLKYGRHELLLRTLGTTQKTSGYHRRDDGTIPFEGNRFRYYSRYRFRAGNDISAGLTSEKDPGEAFFAGSNKSGFDYYSGHISFKLSPVFENITVGDFVVRSGQGLVLWQGYSFGKSVSTLEISKTNQGIRPFTSTDENRFFRGAATTVNFSGTRVSLFFSQKHSDANLAFTDSLGTYFTSLQTSGYHRTENEISDKNSVQDMNTGAVISKQFTHLKLGVSLLYRRFEMPYIRSDQPYNRFRFSGNENLVAGADYLFSKGKYQLFGEAAISKSNGKAFLQGAVAHLHDRFQLAALFRHFDKNYHALWATPFAEGSSAENETGLYFGTRILPVKYVALSAYSDFYRSKWIKYTTAGPSTGWEVFSQADFYFPGNVEFYFRYKNEVRDHRFRESGRYVNLPEQFRKSRLHFQYQLSETVKLKTRFEHVFYNGQKSENGFMVFQDVQYSSKSFPLNLSARVAWFDTESYNSRIYAYENDLLYTFAIPAFFGEGFRTYLNLKYKISEKTEIWFKLANTLRNDVETLSSGYNEIDGNQKTEVKFQLRLKL